jgi:hypothetical protein
MDIINWTKVEEISEGLFVDVGYNFSIERSNSKPGISFGPYKKQNGSFYPDKFPKMMLFCPSDSLLAEYKKDLDTTFVTSDLSAKSAFLTSLIHFGFEASTMSGNYTKLLSLERDLKSAFVQVTTIDINDLVTLFLRKLYRRQI